MMISEAGQGRGWSPTRHLILYLTDYSNPNSLGSRFRRKRAQALLGVIDRIHRERGRVNILDIGGWPSYWQTISLDELRKRNCHIHLVNIEDPGSPGDIFSSSAGDGRSLDFPDDSFDLVHANSVIEHVGTWRDMKAFAGEVSRLAPAFFIQTPAFGFPIEPHYGLPFIHWLAPQMRTSLLRHMRLGRWDKTPDVGEATRLIEDSSLLTRAQFASLFADARIETERFCGLSKSYAAIRESR
jgi:hypothetical protein